MGMVGIAMDDPAPLDGCSRMLLNAGRSRPLAVSLEINVRVFRRDDYLEDALVTCLLPTVCQGSQRMIPSQAETVGVRHS